MRTRKAPIDAPINPIKESNTGIPLVAVRRQSSAAIGERRGTEGDRKRGIEEEKRETEKWGKRWTDAASTKAAMEQPPTQENQTR